MPVLVEGQTSTTALIERINFLSRKIEALESVGFGGKGKGQLTDSKSFQDVKNFGGEPKDWKDWEFKFHNFVRPFPGFEQWLNWIKEMEDPPTKLDRDTLQEEANLLGKDIDFDWYDEQLYSMLCAKCVDTHGALGTVQLLADQVGTRGMLSWFKLS